MTELNWHLNQCDIVTVYDPARTRESEYGHLARNAVMTTACTPDYDVVVLDYYAGRGSFGEVWQAIKDQTTLYRPRCLGIEDVATQIALGDAFEKIGELEEFELPFIEPLRPDSRVNKKFRIRTTLQRVAQIGKFYALSHHYELRQEWEAFPNGRTIDLLDTAAYGVMLHNIPDEFSIANYNKKLKERMRSSQPSPFDSFDEIDRLTSEADPRYRVPTMPKNLAILRYA